MVFLSLLPAADAAQFYVLVVLSVTAASKKGSHKSSDYCWPAIAIAAQLLCLPVMDIFFRHSDSPPLLTEIFGTYSWIARHTKRYGNTLEKSAHPVLVVFPMSSLKQKKFVTFSLLLVQWGGKLRRRNRVIHSWDGSMLACRLHGICFGKCGSMSDQSSSVPLLAGIQPAQRQSTHV